MAQNSGTIAPPKASLAATVRKARADTTWTARELARRAGVSHTQISRIESGQVAKPSREVLVAIARALERNPLPLLILAEHLTPSEAQEGLRPLFREGAELPEEWGEWTALSLEEVQSVIRDAQPSEGDLRLVAADVFRVRETEETLWDESHALAAARGEEAAELREVMAIWRYLGRDLRRRWLDHGRRLRAVADLEWRAEAEAIRLQADLEKGRSR